MANVNENSPAFRAAYLSALLARHYPAARPHHIALIVARCQAATRQALAWGVRCCNVAMDEKQEERGQRRIEKLQADINATLAKASLNPHSDYGTGGMSEPAKLSLGGDPRGPCGRLVIPGMAGDGWGDGFAIY